jgi:hypothetical protein
MEDDDEIREIAIFSAQESGQQEMGEGERAFLLIREDKDDINLREQLAKPLHLLKLFPVRSRENRNRIWFDGLPEPRLKVIQLYKKFDLIFRDHLMNGRFKPLFILIFSA